MDAREARVDYRLYYAVKARFGQTARYRRGVWRLVSEMSGIESGWWNLAAGGIRGLVALMVAVGGTSTVIATEPPAMSSARRTPIVNVVERCRDAVVNISTTKIVNTRAYRDVFEFGFPRVRQRAVESVGSGFVVHESGLIVTNAHVVAQAADIKVIFPDEKTYAAELLASDPKHDLAVLKVDAGRDLPFLRPSRGDDLMIGETVVAIGNPLGLGHSVSAGIVSALRRDLEIGPQFRLEGLIQTDAPINPGNSGGPLLNIEGQLIGVNTAIRGDAQSIGFAIPVDRIWELLPSMLDFEKRDGVGIGLEVDGRDVRITKVRPAGPAESAGLRIGDRITAIDAKQTRDGIDYYAQLARKAAGQPVKLSVLRDNRAMELQLSLQPLPPPDGAALALRKLGVNVLEVPDDIAQRNNVPSYARVMIDSVQSRSPAAEVGLRRGDFIIGIGRGPISTLDGLGRALDPLNSGDDAIVYILRWQDDPPSKWVAEMTVR